MGLSTTPNPAVLDALRVAVLSDDGLTLTLAGQLDADTYRRVKKVLDVYGGKWNRKAGTHTFASDFRPHLAHLIGGGKVGADNGGKNPLDFFATPAPVITEMFKRIWPWRQGARFLEPSAGEGAIVDALHEDHGVRADCLELHPDRADAIRKRGYDVIGGDFLTFTPEQPYDYVLMNPPFTAQGDAWAYITHVEHALTCLKPGGQLVAVVPQGYTFGTYKRIQAFREFCEANAASPMHTFAPDTFRASGTSVATCLIHVTKPTTEEAVMPAPKKASRSSKKTAPVASASPWHAGDCVLCRPNGTTVIGAVLEVHANLAAVQHRNGTLALPLTDITGVDDYPAALPLQAGDRVRLRQQQGRTFQVLATAALDADVQLVDVDSGDELTVPAKDARVARRADPQNLLVDLGFKPVPEQLVTLKAKRQQPVEDMPFPVSEAELEAAIVEPAPAPAHGPILNTDQLSWLPVTALVASPLNPRKKFPQEALESLANSIAAKGLMQNLVGRVMPGADTVEVIAGGRRLRALTLLHDTGRLPDEYLVPVRVQEMTDLDALMLAVAENSERADVEPLEEADAFVEMIRLGASVEDIALRFKCSPRVVEKRLVLAGGLGDDGRALLDSKAISISQAQVIAQTSGPLRSHVITAAKRGDTVKSLQSLIAKSTFLVDRAKFDVAASGLEVIEDLFSSEPARFADPKAALALQLDWAEARKAALSKKKEQFFVEVRKVNDSYLQLPYDTYTTYDAPNSIFGTVIMVSTITGEVAEKRCARTADVKSARAKETAKARAQTASEATGSSGGGAIRKSGWVDAHEARATALRAALVGDHKRTVALTILSILQAQPVTLRGSLDHAQAVPITAGMTRLKEIDAKLGGKLGVNDHHLPKRPITKKFGYDNDGVDVLPYLDLLMTLTLEELLDVQSVLIAQAVGGWTEYNPMHAPYAFVTRLAADTGATVQMRLTDAHLKAYPRDRLIELAEDAGIAEGHGVKAGHISTLATNTDIRAAILQHADALAQRGYVPPLARFPEVAAPQTAATAAD
ncbi:ParB/RepB/Spo0J family partition protein [Deinococcus soli (ex Cha et al. 2016)]|uniref:ParB/RepB/Spo0J family partition protein n=1 Tax=Deinococcus soli (ex Cha et al. 2016) TaxID=1309411 RepID=UPI0016674CAE|nr:ParB/RepB/Spo0J family partition protein [Deinococcus soli (ex Cha et al. 2016)]GGB64741.1 hypothetical protein GCM10008019_21090 [Deinococcus soli (ex Cha et al. 2016)]